MEAWFNQTEKHGLPAQRAATEGENEYFPQDAHTVTHTAKMGGHAERPFTALGAQPQVGVRGIQALKNKFVEKGLRPEEKYPDLRGRLGVFIGDLPRTAAGGLSRPLPVTHEACFWLLPGVGQFCGMDLRYPPRGHVGRTDAIGQTFILSASGASGGEGKPRSQHPNSCQRHPQSQKRRKPCFSAGAESEKTSRPSPEICTMCSIWPHRALQHNLLCAGKKDSV
ncbi:hypothetical protein DQ04_11091010 [Trypanosoma grayi]|uniref:hypothetical protein n=1 Tax=Trypanosoma grayi TaxID=71804 RepID=UPI0004F4A9B0|nr:hypothetical protein DQ04_11091010 [Trypanosoma grayi]KEG07056.1 hypothetical protein DQ04_11091010 [Trypanosoma grayi]